MRDRLDLDALYKDWKVQTRSEGLTKIAILLLFVVPHPVMSQLVSLPSFADAIVYATALSLIGLLTFRFFYIRHNAQLARLKPHLPLTALKGDIAPFGIRFFATNPIFVFWFISFLVGLIIGFVFNLIVGMIFAVGMVFIAPLLGLERNPKLFKKAAIITTAEDLDRSHAIYLDLVDNMRRRPDLNWMGIVFSHLGSLKMFRGEIEDGFALLQAAVAIHPTNLFLILILIDDGYFEQNNNPERALELINYGYKVDKEEKHKAACSVLEAWAHAQLGNVKSATESLEEFYHFSFESSNTQIHDPLFYVAGRTEALLGNTVRARENFERARQGSKRFPLLQNIQKALDALPN